MAGSGRFSSPDPAFLLVRVGGAITDKAMIVATTGPARREFNKLLGDWYMNSDPAVIDWLADFHAQVDGLDDYGPRIHRAAPGGPAG